jgi:hypothetical protein
VLADARERIRAPAVSAARDCFDPPPGFDLGERFGDHTHARPWVVPPATSSDC